MTTPATSSVGSGGGGGVGVSSTSRSGFKFGLSVGLSKLYDFDRYES